MDTSATIIESCVTDVAASQLDGIDDLCLANLHVDKNRMSKRIAETYEKTRGLAFDAFACKGMYVGFPIKHIDEGKVKVGDLVFESEPLASALSGATEAVAFGVAAHGFEGLFELSGNTGLDEMFFSGWGTGFSTSCQQWVELTIRDKAHERGFYTGKSWCPGEDGIELALQTPLFELVDFSQIGLTLKENLNMRPVMSVTGFIGVFDDPDVELQESSWMV